jgi:hypothetical protein
MPSFHTKKLVMAAAMLLAFLILNPGPGLAVSPPPGFFPLESQPGLELFRKDYPGGTPDYVLVVDLRRQTGLHLLHGEVSDPGGGDSPRFARQSLEAFWQDFSADQNRAACVVNAGFFSPNEDPSPLAFGVKTGGRILSEGYGRDEFTQDKLLLELWPERARISPFNETAFKNSDAPQALVGLSEHADKNATALVGRTFIGLADSDQDGFARMLLIFSSKTARQADAVEVLRSFGAQQVMMLDGGDSSQLLCSGQPYVYSERSIPQALGVSAGIIADYEAVVERQTDWPVLVEGENTSIEIVLKNNGSKAWQPGEITLQNRRNDWGAGEQFVINQVVAPDETATFTWQTSAFGRSGVFTSQWDMLRGGQSISDRPIQVNVIVIPKELESKKQELEAQVRDWARQKLENIEQLVLEWIRNQISQSADRFVDWIQNQIRAALDRICPSAALLPGMLILAGFLRARRRDAL